MKKIRYVLHNNQYTINWNGVPIHFYVSESIELRRGNSFNNEPMTKKWIESFNKNDIFWDVGANVGVFSLFAALKIKCKVISFEPVFHNFNTLNRNIIANGVNDRVLAFCLALHEKTDIDKLYVSNLNSGSSMSNFKKNKNSKYVQGSIGMSIDSLTIFLPFPTHLKIDVDGNELLIIKGAEKTLSDKRLKSVLIEINSNNKEEFISILGERGFTVYEKEFESHQENYISENYLFLRKNIN